MRVLTPADRPRAKPRLQTKALAEHKPGVGLRIMAVQLESHHKAPLYRLGLVEGRVLRLVHNDFKGRLVVEMDGQKVILGFQESRRILVRPVA